MSAIQKQGDVMRAEKMKPEVKARWVAALRSGEYRQGIGELRSRNDEFCCIGVLCDLMDPNAWVRHYDEPNEFPYGFERSSDFDLPAVSTLRDWAAFDYGVQVRIGDAVKTLDSHNDEGRTFAEIADAIEEQL